MSSDKQIAANRENSKKSTGPKTKKGKSISAKNSRKHGIFVGESRLPWENADSFEELRQSMRETLAPAGAVEQVLVERIIWITWRLRRVARIENGIYLIGRQEKFQKIFEERVIPNAKALPKLLGLEIDACAIERLKDWACNIVFETSPDIGEITLTFKENEATLATLSRYEAGLERSLYKALHELQRLQAVRAGQHVPAPIAIDVGGDSGNL